MFASSYLQVAEHLVEQYNLQMPLYLFLKNYFRQNKKFGSRDRKYITELVFGFYRIPSFNRLKKQDQILYGSFLSGRLPQLFFEKTFPEGAPYYHQTLQEKINYLKQLYQVDFDLSATLTEGVSITDYIHYLFQEKSVFLRIRRNKEGILSILKKQGISFQQPTIDSIAIQDKIDLETALPQKEDYVIQDLSTQQVARFLHPQSHETWWDCCAASGGKSLLLLDKNHDLRLFASDIRSSILENYRQRLRTYHYDLGKRVFLHDASQPLVTTDFKEVDHIICDVPCSGSGTWAQAPEQGYFFTEEKLHEFHKLQCKIVQQVWHYLKSGGNLIYITCSIWKMENDDVIQTLLQNGQAKLIQREVINTSAFGGDIIFVTVVEKI